MQQRGGIRTHRARARIEIVVILILSAAALHCGGTPPEVVRVPIPGSTLALVVTKDDSKHMHYAQLFDGERATSKSVMLTGYMAEDLKVDRVDSQGDEVSIFLRGAYPVVVKVDSRRGVILSGPSAPPVQE